MSRFSVLDYRDSWQRDVAPSVTILALHGKGGSLAGLESDPSIFGPDTRWVMPIAARGIYRGVDNIGRTWFGGTLASPEPASFGDSLAQLERIVYDDRQRSEQWSAQCPWIVGVGQGAVLALALALTLPEFVSGVVAVGGALPRFRDATLLEGRPMNMPILMLSPSLDGSVSPEHQQESLQRLQSLGADVRSVELELAAVLGESAATILRDWWTSHSFT